MKWPWTNVVSRETRKLRKNALADLRRHIVETTLSSHPETRFRVYGLTGPETCHNMYVTHANVSPFKLTTVSVEENVDGARPVSIQFQWSGPMLPDGLADAVVSAYAGFFRPEAAE